MAKAMPVRTAQVALEGDYAGFAVTVRLNPSYAVKQDLNSGDTERVLAALKVIIHGWDLTDEAGQALPTPAGGCDLRTDIPDEVLGAIIRGYVGELNRATELPKA